VHIVLSDGGEIKIDQVREVQAGLALKPFEGSKKVLIVDGAESMNTAAANAFLKTLEEPPGDALIVLITSMPQSLLATIRSRCQEIRFLPLSRHALAQALVQRRGLSEADAWFLAALAQGSLGRAMEMDVEREKAEREEVNTLRFRLAEMSPGEVLAQAEGLSKDRERLERFLDIGVEQIRDTLVLRETGDEQLLVNGRGKDLHQEGTEQVPLERMLADMELLTVSRGLLDRRVSAQLVAEHLLMKLGRR
jgi:DNA polymerase-3 subunit delta'